MRRLMPLLAGLLLPASLCLAQAPQPAGIAFSGFGRTVRLTPAELAGLPSETLAISFQTEHGTRQGQFRGPLLWSVLRRTGLLADDPPKAQERQVLAVRGADGYQVVVALAELSPDFEGKRVVLAEAADGRPLAPGHWRIVLPGDRRGGRSVHDVTDITLLSPLR